MTSIRERALRNSLLIREVNERITEVSDAWVDGERRELLCECGDDGCIEAILVMAADFHEARSRPSRFLVTSNHGREAGTELLLTRDGYAIVDYGESPAGSAA
jgi:hypothetical protein